MRPLLIVPALFGTTLTLPGTRFLWGRFMNFYGGARLAELGADLPGSPAEVIKAFSILPGLLAYDVLGSLQKALNHAGYKLDRDLFFFSYDWRLRVTDVAPSLATAIEQLAERTGSEVDVLGLSNGGLVVRGAFAQPRELPVARVVTSGTPHAGCVEALACLHSGFQFAPLGRRVSPQEFMACPGSLDCLPGPEHATFLEKPHHLYEANTWSQLGIAVFRDNDPSLAARWEPVLNTRLEGLRATWNALGSGRRPKHLTCVVGKGLATQARVPVVGGKILAPGEGKVRNLPADALEEGDGGVTLESGAAWRGDETQVLRIPVSRHRDVVRTPPAFEAILAGLA